MKSGQSFRGLMGGFKTIYSTIENDFVLCVECEQSTKKIFDCIVFIDFSLESVKIDLWCVDTLCG